MNRKNTIRAVISKIALTLVIAFMVTMTGSATQGSSQFVATASLQPPPPQPSDSAIVETETVYETVPAEEPLAGVSQPQTGDLTGSIGYALPYGNCVNQINPRPTGNPITWPVRSQTPTIGSAALFHYNHVGRVVGIWSNGDLEIAHENYQGGQHRFPRSTFRGFW